jgi:hypothetical protein
MKSVDSAKDSLPTEAWQRVAEIAERFESAWETGQRPAIHDFLPPDADE